MDYVVVSEEYPTYVHYLRSWIMPGAIALVNFVSKKLTEIPIMKTYLCALCAAALLTPGLVAADENTEESKPIELNEVQMDQVTAGTGRDNVALQPWPALFAAGFVPTHNGKADGGVIDHAGFVSVIVPRRP